MMIYLTLPFENRYMDQSNTDFRIAGLAPEYAIRFGSTNRYRYKRRLAEYHSKYLHFSSQKCSLWVYEDTDPKTLSLWHEEVNK